ncbi:phosphotransferase [Paenisporosarcina quisquiliarum]|uniref:Phosphotransferase n=1 Tax=Paenisporosarcina quisquiliarum TaxID=365346 RepID=A0A9X3LDT6_9BACL|nr:phosphotransferase [Paenisporosarcina quisquiliarum]
MWKWQIGPHAYSLKKYEYEIDADKIRYIHEQLTKAGADFMVPIEPYPDAFVIQQPWIESGKKVQFNQSEDRKKSLEVLHQLHATRNQVAWQKSGLFQEIDLNRKWAHRLEKWQQVEPFLIQKLGSSKTQRITKLAKDSLAQLKPIRRENVTLLHGDVVHHNFVRDHKNRMYIIDFDLACIGPAEVELILWSHRVLPHFDYDLDALIKEHPSLANIDWNYLLFPNELMREWLYATTLSDLQLQGFIPKLKKFTNNALKRMPQLWEDCDRLT